MNPKTLLIIGGVLAGAYVILKPKSASAAGMVTQDFNGLPLGATTGPTLVAPKGYAHFGGPSLADQRAAVGARAVSSNGSAGGTSLVNSALSAVNAKVATTAGSVAGKVIPGSGSIVTKISGTVGSVAASGAAAAVNKAGDLAVKGIKKLKFW